MSHFKNASQKNWTQQIMSELPILSQAARRQENLVNNEQQKAECK
jgi:hypothetical protein